MVTAATAVFIGTSVTATAVFIGTGVTVWVFTIALVIIWAIVVDRVVLQGDPSGIDSAFWIFFGSKLLNFIIYFINLDQH